MELKKNPNNKHTVLLKVSLCFCVRLHYSYFQLHVSCKLQDEHLWYSFSKGLQSCGLEGAAEVEDEDMHA